MGLFEWFASLYKKSSEKVTFVPEHLAIIMDGNGRWAEKQGLSRSAGHRAGMERISDAIDVCREYGVSYLTLYAFSTENWLRPTEEVRFLMKLFEEALQKEMQQLRRQGVRIKFIGLRERLSPGLLRLMEENERQTVVNDGLTLNIALNYGGRAEILNAAREIGRAVRRGEIDPEELTETDFTERLFTAGQPDPDLLIRPGGESRISNFLIWQLAYTELYFSDIYWPDFGRNELIEAFRFYSRIERRFGGLKRRKAR